MRTTRLLAFALALLVASAPAAHAQGHPEPRLSAMVGIGQANPIPVDLPYTARTWSGSVLMSVARHVLLEGVVSGWRHTLSNESNFDNSSATRASYLHFIDTQHDSQTTAALNLLAAGRIKRVRLTSGVGFGIARFSSRYVHTIIACAAPYPGFCDSGDSSEQTTWFLSAQPVMGIDVAITSRARVSLTYRLSHSFTTELGDVSVLAGVTIGLR